MSDYWSEENRKHREEHAERKFRCEMRRNSHKRWQRPREWNGGWANPVPDGAPVSIWRNHPQNDCWNYHRHADRVDWTEVRAYRLEHGMPYHDSIQVPKPIPPEIFGTLPPALQFRLDRIDAALARLEALFAEPSEHSK